MNAKEKAEELIARFRFISYDLDDIANHKECAMVAVDEVIDQIYKSGEMSAKAQIEWWKRVKSELQSF